MYFTHFFITFLGEPIFHYFDLRFAVCFQRFDMFFVFLLELTGSLCVLDRVLETIVPELCTGMYFFTST